MLCNTTYELVLNIEFVAVLILSITVFNSNEYYQLCPVVAVGFAFVNVLFASLLLFFSSLLLSFFFCTVFDVY